MTTPEDKIEIVRETFEALDRGDWAAVANSFSADVVWHNHGSHRFTGEFRGQGAVFGMLATMWSLIDAGSGKFEIHDITASADHAVSLVRAKSTRSEVGKALDIREIHVMHFDDEQKICEFWAYSENQAINDDYWGGAPAG